MHFSFEKHPANPFPSFVYTAVSTLAASYFPTSFQGKGFVTFHYILIEPRSPRLELYPRFLRLELNLRLPIIGLRENRRLPPLRR